jgi:hypothetical protein
MGTESEAEKHKEKTANRYQTKEGEALEKG